MRHTCYLPGGSRERAAVLHLWQQTPLRSAVRQHADGPLEIADHALSSPGMSLLWKILLSCTASSATNVGEQVSLWQTAAALDDNCKAAVIHAWSLLSGIEARP